MAMSTILNAGLAAGATVTSSALVLTNPQTLVDFEISTQWAKASPHGLLLGYQISLDGTTFGDIIPTHIEPVCDNTAVHLMQATVNAQNAAKMQFVVTNRDPAAALTNVTIQVIQF